MTFTEEEVDMLRWVIRSERKVQYMIVDPDPVTVEALENLYDKVSSLIPNKSLGEL